LTPLDCLPAVPPGNRTPAREFSMEASIAKLFASEMATPRHAQSHPDSRRQRVQQRISVERAYRDARITEIYEGTSEISDWSSPPGY